jgi:hypothetical protein
MRRRFALACLVLAAIAVAPAVGAQADSIAVPDALRVPGGNVLLFKTFATGAQIYVCAAKADDPETFAWTFTAPDAELWNDAGEKVGSHFAGPSWAGNDGSRVVAEVVGRAEGAPGAIPWLLLKAKSSDGAGAFSTLTYIQRLETSGGIVPTERCDRSMAGAERAVPYTATYAFYYGPAQ